MNGLYSSVPIYCLQQPIIIQSMHDQQPQQGPVERNLWCLPYDTDSVFKSFLNVPFSQYLREIISNHYFNAYQKEVAKEIQDPSLWNEKSWLLIQFFQFLNREFELNTWDSKIWFIQENVLRKTMGFFRLWIDTERLYLLNFLKLDSNEFQEQRIYMSLFRVLLYLNHLFTEYMFKDFNTNFLMKFIKNATGHLTSLFHLNTNETGELIATIIQLLKNIKNKERIYVDSSRLTYFKKMAVIKINKLDETIKEIQTRLANSAKYKNASDQKLRLKRLTNDETIYELTEEVKVIYDPAEKIRKDYKERAQENNIRSRDHDKFLNLQIQNFKNHNKSPIFVDTNIYETLIDYHHNPYEQSNYQIYGESIELNMAQKDKYQKKNKTEVISTQTSDKSKFFYEEKFLNDLENSTFDIGRVTERDIKVLSKQSEKKSKDYKDNDDSTKVFNLKWHHDEDSIRKDADTTRAQEKKDYDNNLLFKSPNEDQLIESKNFLLDTYKNAFKTKSYTIALIEKEAADIHPEDIKSSYSFNPFMKKESQLLEVTDFKLMNQNKFDFLRKVVGFMTAQKKIKNIISEKNISDYYPRQYSDIKQKSYDLTKQNQKRNFVMGITDQPPDIIG